MQALISLQYKARALGTSERESFFRKVCNYYKLDPKQVFEYAAGIYYDPEIQAKRGKFPSIGDRRLLEVARQAQVVYDFQPRVISAVRRKGKPRPPEYEI